MHSVYHDGSSNQVGLEIWTACCGILHVPSPIASSHYRGNKSEIQVSLLSTHEQYTKQHLWKLYTQPNFSSNWLVSELPHLVTKLIFPFLQGRYSNYWITENEELGRILQAKLFWSFVSQFLVCSDVRKWKLEQNWRTRLAILLSSLHPTILSTSFCSSFSRWTFLSILTANRGESNMHTGSSWTSTH